VGDRAARVPVVRAPVTRTPGTVAALGQGFNELADTAADLERRLGRYLETRAEFVSLVSHELRTPLTAIGGYVKLLIARDAGEINPTQEEFFGDRRHACGSPS